MRKLNNRPLSKTTIKQASYGKVGILEKIKKYFSFRRRWKALIYYIILLSITTYLFWGIPIPTKISDSQPVSTKIFDRNEKLVYEIYTDKKRTPVKLSDLPDSVKKATIAIEDKDFYKHQGFSFQGITRALFNNIVKRDLQGGSTITQQLVKNGLLTQERTIKRKARELILTIIIEGVYTKDQILEMYLNTIPYGGTVYGIEAASETYFGKDSKELSLAEASLLAGLPQRPSSYSPFGSHPEYAKARQEEVLKQMVLNGFISQEESEKTKSEVLKYAQKGSPEAPHFSLWIKDQLTEKYGDKMVEQGGLRVYTTLDLEIQKFAQESVASEVAKLKKQKVGNGAAIVTKPSTGEILAMVGSKDYFADDEDGKVNIILRERQPGSSIKPLNYALAIKDKKITPATSFADIPTCFKVLGQADYCPVNYDGGFHGLVQTRFALGNSYNIPAVKTLALNGVENFIDFAKKLGITTFDDPKNYGLSLTLGGGEVRPIDMAEAFGVFANSGIRQPLVAVTKVTDWKGNILEEKDIKKQELSGERILEPSVTYLISHILLDNNARSGAFGPSSFLNIKGYPDVSVKTGTTNDRKDNWTIGYTNDVVTVVWVGNNDNTPMSGAVSGVSGASPIWNKVMRKALDMYQPEDHTFIKQPDGVIGANICADTGDNRPDCPRRFEYFLAGTISSASGVVNQDIFVYNDTGQMAQEGAPPESIHPENKPVYTDPTGAKYCLTCAVASASATIRYPLVGR